MQIVNWKEYTGELLECMISIKVAQYKVNRKSLVFLNTSNK